MKWSRGGAILGCVAALAGCELNAERTEAASSGDPATSSASGVARVTRPMTVRAMDRTNYAFCGPTPIEGLLVIVNAADGSLLEQATTDVTGVAVLDVADGDYLSALSPATELSGAQLDTVLVTPGIVSHEWPGFSGAGCNFDATMHLDVTVEPIAASSLAAVVGDVEAPVDLATFTASLEARVLPMRYENPFGLLILDEGDRVVGATTGIPWVNDGSASVSVAMGPAPITITQFALGHAPEDFTGEAFCVDGSSGRCPSVDAFSATPTADGSELSITMRPIPGVRIQGGAYVGDLCNAVAWSEHLAPTDPLADGLVVDPKRLATPQLGADGAWRLLGGDLGDIVQYFSRLGPQDDPTSPGWWLALPASESLAIPAKLSLPTEYEGFFDRPASTTSIDHLDHRGTDGYAAALALPHSANAIHEATKVTELRRACH